MAKRRCYWTDERLEDFTACREKGMSTWHLCKKFGSTPHELEQVIEYIKMSGKLLISVEMIGKTRVRRYAPYMAHGVPYAYMGVRNLV